MKTGYLTAELKKNTVIACIALLCLILSNQALLAQKKTQISQVSIDHAEELTATKLNGQDVKRLKGNVQFHHEDIIMNCDSAYLNSETNTLNAFGNVHINQHDSMHLYGQTLDYDGNRKYAVVKKNVSLTDSKMQLSTDRLDYDRSTRVAFYTNGGTITDAQNTLTSKKGYYFSSSRDLYFKDDVVLINPDYTMKGDTLQYNIISRRAIFHGPTIIVSKKDTIYCETGWYNTLTGEAHFGKNARLHSGGQVLYGDSLVYNRQKSIGRAIGRVKIVDTAEKLTVSGDLSEHFEKTKRTFITKNVIVSKAFKDDTLFMTADTMWSEYDSSGRYRILRGYQRVRMFSRQFQGRCDSIKYSFVDSTIDMRIDPVMWFSGYQTSADRILIHTKQNSISRADYYRNSFMVSPEDSERYSQIKGRDMTGFFKNNELDVVDVNGNGESIYYVRDEKKAYMGANRIVSSNIRIKVKDRKVNRINFIKDPDATLIPIRQADPPDLRLPGFRWRGGEKPSGLADLQLPPPAKNPDTAPEGAKKNKKKTTPKAKKKS